MRVLLATGSPGTITFAGPITWWTNTASEFSRIKLVAGDFNLDGRADVVEFYDYGGERTAIFMHYASGTGFPGGTQQWDSGAGNWAWSHGKYVVGDFSGDGRPDIAVLYDYNNSQVSLLVFPANASGSFAGGWQSWWGPAPPGAGTSTRPRPSPVTSTPTDAPTSPWCTTAAAPCSPTNLAGQVTLQVSGGGQYLVRFAHTSDRCIGVWAARWATRHRSRRPAAATAGTRCCSSTSPAASAASTRRSASARCTAATCSTSPATARRTVR